MPFVQSQLSLDALEAYFPQIGPLLADDQVTEIMVVSGRAGVLTFFEKSGRLYEQKLVDVSFRDLERFCIAVARPLGLDPDKEPLLDARLVDGSRVALCVPPATPWPALTIRRFGKRQFSGADLVRMGSLPQEVLDRMAVALLGSGNVLVAGGTGSGKTTLLNALIQQFPMEDRILVVEDTIELHVSQPNCVRMEARNLDRFKLSARDMVKHALRHRPDHIVIGEVRGAEAQDVLQALNTGHGGSLTTIHANTARDALTRLASCAAQATDALPWDILCQFVAMAFELVVHQTRLPSGKRGISELIKVNGYEKATALWQTEVLWSRPEPSKAPAAGQRVVAPARAVVTIPGRGRVAAPVGGPPRPARVGDPGSTAPPKRLGEASAMVVRGWGRRKLALLSESAQATGKRPRGRSVRVVVTKPGFSFPEEYTIDTISPRGSRVPAAVLKGESGESEDS